MKIKFMAIASVFLLVIGFSMSAYAGAVADADGDTVPDAFDNCVNNANATQADTDGDGFGNACDCDFVAAPGDGFILGADILDLFNNFGGTSALHDVTEDGFVLGGDVLFCFGQFGGAPG